MSEVAKKSGRPRGGIFPDGGATLSVWVPRSLAKALITVSDAKQKSVSAVVRDLLVYALANPPAKVEMPSRGPATSSEEAAR